MKLPVVPTVMVALSLPILIWLGFWQLGRAAEKDAQLAALASAPQMARVDFGGAMVAADYDFRRVSVTCADFGEVSAKAGRSETGVVGFSYFATCTAPGHGPVNVNLGWDQRPDRIGTEPQSGVVPGMLRAPRDAELPPVLIAELALAGLAPSRIPTVDDIPDNHTSYAFQWFGFAAVLSIIYFLFVRGWRQERPQHRA